MHERQGDAQAGRMLQKRAPPDSPLDERVECSVLDRPELRSGAVDQFGAIIAA